MTFRDDILESVSLLPPEDPVRVKLEADLLQAPEATRRRYAQLLAEAEPLRDAITAPASSLLAVPESLLARLRQIPTRTPVRHAHFLTPFRAVAAAALLLLMLAPAAAWFLPPAMVHQRLLALPNDVIAAADAPGPIAATQPSQLDALFAQSSLSFMPSFPDPKPGATFLGGGITRLAGKPAAFAQYALKGKTLTLFQVARSDFPLPEEGQYPLVCTTAGDRTVHFWTPSDQAATLFLVVGQCGEEADLTGFTQLPAAATQP